MIVTVKNTYRVPRPDHEYVVNYSRMGEDNCAHREPDGFYCGQGRSVHPHEMEPSEVGPPEPNEHGAIYKRFCTACHTPLARHVLDE